MIRCLYNKYIAGNWQITSININSVLHHFNYSLTDMHKYVFMDIDTQKNTCSLFEHVWIGWSSGMQLFVGIGLHHDRTLGTVSGSGCWVQ